MWECGTKVGKINRKTNIKMGVLGDEKYKASDAEWRVLAMNRVRESEREREMA